MNMFKQNVSLLEEQLEARTETVVFNFQDINATVNHRSSKVCHLITMEHTKKAIEEECFRWSGCLTMYNAGCTFLKFVEHVSSLILVEVV